MRSFQLEKETGEKVRKGCEEGSEHDVSGFPCSLSATYLILPASSFLRCAFHGIHVPQQMLGASCRTCSVTSASRSAFTQHWVWVTFPDLVRIKFAQLQRSAQVLLTHPSLPKREMEAEPCNHTWPVYEVAIPWLRWGIQVCVSLRLFYNTQSNGFAWAASQSSYITYLQTELTARAAVLLNSCTALLLFVVCLAFL